MTLCLMHLLSKETLNVKNTQIILYIGSSPRVRALQVLKKGNTQSNSDKNLELDNFKKELFLANQKIKDILE